MAISMPTWFPCMSGVTQRDDASTLHGAAGAPTALGLQWKPKVLKVDFWKEEEMHKWGGPEKLDIDEHILPWANAWHEAAPETIPKFVRCPDGELSDVRVEFSSTKLSFTHHIGNEASSYEDEATVTLNLTYYDIKGYRRDYQQHLVMHEFGHVLGLGHEHQTSALQGALLDREQLLQALKSDGMADKEAEGWLNQYSTYPNPTAGEKGTYILKMPFDPKSVMCYPIREKYFKDSFKDESKEKNIDFVALTTVSYDDRIHLALSTKKAS